MGQRRHTPEQIINQLREAEVELGRGMKVPEVCKKLGIAEYTLWGGKTPSVSVAPIVGCQYSIRICGAHSPGRPYAWWTGQGTDARPPVSVDPVRDRQRVARLHHEPKSRTPGRRPREHIDQPHAASLPPAV
jgi:hypothetical protein